MLRETGINLIGESELHSAGVKLWDEANHIKDADLLGNGLWCAKKSFLSPFFPDEFCFSDCDSKGKLIGRIWSTALVRSHTMPQYIFACI
jgi:hypothetical protein